MKKNIKGITELLRLNRLNGFGSQPRKLKKKDLRKCLKDGRKLLQRLDPLRLAVETTTKMGRTDTKLPTLSSKLRGFVLQDDLIDAVVSTSSKRFPKRPSSSSSSFVGGSKDLERKTAALLGNSGSGFMAASSAAAY